MDGIHDMGGMHGFGPVPWVAEEPPFHAEWERRVWGLMFSTTRSAGTTLDGDRSGLERIPPALYLNFSYFERWLYHLTSVLLADGAITVEELEAGQARPDSLTRTDAAGPESVDPYHVPQYRREIPTRPAFSIGRKVRTGNPHPAGHTRLPRYARGRTGQIVLHHGAHVLPDSNAHGNGEAPTHLYNVRFAARELWGPEADANDTVRIDIWECHLEAI